MAKLPLPENKIKEVIAIAQKQVDSCLAFRQPRFDQIKRSEDMYLGKTKPALKGRFNIPLPILEGFVETLMSKIDDTVKITFKKGRESVLKAAKKVSAAWDKDSAPDRGDFNGADLDAKKLAIFSGFGALGLIPQANPYKQTLSAIDYHDLIFEPLGGRDLEKHAFKGKLNVFKSREELKLGVKEGIYNKGAVAKMINAVPEKDTKEYEDEQKNKINRFEALGLNPEMYSYIGGDTYNFTELVTRFQGEDYYLLFERKTGKWVRFELLKEMFHSGLSPYIVWHTSRSPVNFLCRAPADGIRPVAEAMRILINQNFDNIQKRNWDQILVNAKKVVNFGELQYRPNGIIRIKLKDNETMANAYEKMQTPDSSTITINLVQWLNNFIGEKTGITPASQGNADEERVGIYYGNIQQVADRLGMTNKFYKQAHIEIGKRYKPNLVQFMPPRKFMVKFIGLKGVQEEELTREEAGENLEVNVVSESAEAQVSEVKQRKRDTSLIMIQGDERLRLQIGDKWLTEEILRNGEYSEEDIKVAMEQGEGANTELMSEAAKAIEEIVAGEEPSIKLNRGANLAFIKKIVTYAYDEESLSDNIFVKLIEYAVKHLEAAQQNELRQRSLQAQQPQGQPIGQPTQPTGQPEQPTQQPIQPAI